MTDYLLLFVGTVLVNNFVLVKFLGLCPFMGVSKKLETAMGMGLATTFVMTLASICAWLIDTWILIPLNLIYLRTLAFILVIAVVVQFTEMVVRKTSPVLYRLLGIFLPLITTNCAVLGVALLNINLGHNKELMEKCRALWEYAYFVNEVKENLKNGAPIESAVAEARKACIDKDILKEFLEKNSSEVEDVILEEFDREWYEKKVREESQRIGLEEGIKKGIKEGREEGEQRVLQLCQKLLEDGRNEELSRIAEDEKLREELYREYGL